MRLCLDTALGHVVCVWILCVCTSQATVRSKRQSSVYFRESPSGVRPEAREREEPRWSSPSDRLHSRSSVIHDPGPSWSSPARQARLSGDPWSSHDDSSDTPFKFPRRDSSYRTLTTPRSTFRFESEEVGSRNIAGESGVEGRSNHHDSSFDALTTPRSTFRFESEEVGSRNTAGESGVEGRSNHHDSSFDALTTPRSTFRFESEEVGSQITGVEGRSNSHDSDDFTSGSQSNESNESFFGKSNSNTNFFSDDTSSKRESGEVFPWKSSDEGGFSKPKHFGRQSKVSPMFDYKPQAADSFEFPGGEDVSEDPRYLSHDTIATISETLGAINTVGRYLVNYTRGGQQRPYTGDRLDTPPPRNNEDVPGAILTISKNVLGRNVTDSLAPLVRVLPIGSENAAGAGVRGCTTPGGGTGHCEDLSNCPQLLLDLGNLRQSICFKSLFVPGVCCPHKGGGASSTFLQEVVTTSRPMILTSKIPLHTVGTQASYTTSTTSQRPNAIDYEFSSPGDCGQQEAPKFRVVGGEEALPGRWPWMAAIFLHGTRRTEFWCGGSLIGSKHILTAAHCTKDTRQRPFAARQFTVRLGDIDLRREDEPSSPQTYRVLDVRAHPRFNRQGFYNDIAVLVLDRPVRRSRYIIPVCLPPPNSRFNNFVGEQPTVIGWGTTYYGGKESTVQRQVALPVWKNDDCDKTYFQPINENFICAGLKEGGKDACQGDSGGPLILKKNGRWMQIGIVSFGNKCGEPGYPGVYTRVTQYLDWISSNMVT